MGLVSGNIAKSKSYPNRVKKKTSSSGGGMTDAEAIAMIKDIKSGTSSSSSNQPVLPEILPSGYGKGINSNKDIIANAPTLPPAPTPTTVQPKAGSGSTQTTGSSSMLSSGFSDAQLEKIYGRYPDKRAFYKDIFKAAKKRGVTDGKSVLQQVNQMMSSVNFPSEDSTFKKREETEEEGLPETGVETIDTIISMNEDQLADQIKMTEDIKDKRLDLADNLTADKEEASKNQAAILEKREQQVNNTFSEIQSQLRDLEEKANKVFDLNVINAVNARAKQLAAKGILTSEQASAATGLMLSDYKANAELKRSEIMVEINEQMINALNEKQASLDAIMSDEMKTEEWKVAMSEKVNGFYSSVLDSYANQWLTANQAINNNITNAYAQKAQVDIAEKVKEVELEMADEYARKGIDTDADRRMDYVLSKVQATDPNMAKYTASLLEGYINDGTFMTLPIEQLIAQVLSQSAQALLVDQGSKVSTQGGTPTVTQTIVDAPEGEQAQVDVGVTPEQIQQASQVAATDSAVNSIANIGQTPEQKQTLLNKLKQFSLGVAPQVSPVLYGADKIING